MKKIRNIMAGNVPKFILAGGTAALCEYTTYVILYNILSPNSIFVSQSISFLTGLIISFVLNKYWVFKSHKNVTHEFIRYLALAGVNIILSNIAIYLLDGVMLLDWRAAKVIVMATVATWNYLLFQKLIFKSD